MIRLVILLLFAVPVSGQITEYLDIAYDEQEGISPNLLSIDAYVPAGNELKPLAIYVHGGAWVTGDKSVFHHKKNLLTSMGYIFVSVNYRLSPFPVELDNPDRIMHPDHPTDVAKAIAHVLDNASNFGGDTSQVFLLGHSAGAHIVSLVATDQQYLVDHGYDVDVIDCLCILDTGGFDLQSWILHNATSPDLFYNAFGTDSIQWRAASPYHQLQQGAYMPDVLLVYQDNFRRVAANRSFANQIRELTSAQVTEISTSYDHSDINQLIGSDDTSESIAYTQEITDWLQGCMSGPSTTVESKDKATFYPNPTSASITLESKGRYTIVTPIGAKVTSIDVVSDGQQVELDLPTGTYYIYSADHKPTLLYIKR